METDRYNIINVLKSTFEKDDTVHAMWLEGADAHGSTDEYSDVDIWFDVEDGYEVAFYQKLKEALSSISPIDFIYKKNHSHSKIRQYFIRLKDTSEFLILDICVQSHSREIEFIKENTDEKVKVLFDKAGVIKYTNLDIDKFDKNIKMRKNEIIKTFKFFSIWVHKEIKRDNFLEALDYYHQYILTPLVEYLRMIHEPTKKDFGLKHIKRDLPTEIVDRLEYFHKISSLEDIKKKTEEALLYINKIVDEKTV
ncbi:MAG: hypothetical protein KAQ68_06015 [Clostridiales bacterium]|nr:hypothetical protein [Clostridiales bacterium]